MGAMSAPRRSPPALCARPGPPPSPAPVPGHAQPQVLAEISRLRAIREEYRADLAALAGVKAQISRLSEAHEGLKWEHEALTQRSALLRGERDALVARFGDAIHEVQKRTALRQVSLQGQLAALQARGAVGGTSSGCASASAEQKLGCS